jgi:hypothetical protein
VAGTGCKTKPLAFRMSARGVKARKRPVCTRATLRYVFTQPWVAVTEWRPLDEPRSCWVAWPVRPKPVSIRHAVTDVLRSAGLPVPLDFEAPDLGFAEEDSATDSDVDADGDGGDKTYFGPVAARSMDALAAAPVGRAYYGGAADRAALRALAGQTRVRVLNARTLGWDVVTVNALHEHMAAASASWGVLDLTVLGPDTEVAAASDSEYSDFSVDDG